MAVHAEQCDMTDFSPLDLTVFAQSVAMIAEEMGTRLERGALSPNIRERRDASSALFDAHGQMIAQAAHIPVHLGAMPDSVRAVRLAGGRPGELWLLNHPDHGGSHLPDLTMVEVIADPADAEAVIGYAAVRAHHADVGGMSPGSMPFGARELVQEGLIIPPVVIADAAGWRTDLLAIVLANVRTPRERLGDLSAQRAACAAGADGWRTAWAQRGAEWMQRACAALLDYTERRVRARLAELDGLAGEAVDLLEGDGVSDDTVPVRVALEIRDRTMHLDLRGSAGRVAGNINAPPAVARAAAVFVLRALCDADVPTNDGIARALSLYLPDDCVANARDGAAVAAGNVELSTRITDAIWLALANAATSQALPLIAQGQGTMNNVTLGGAGWTFYETLGGGQGANAHGNGPSAVHVGMSNTRNTPVEALEQAYPLRIDRYALRRGSGGGGRWSGGDGIERAYRALVPCTATVLADRRHHPPRGAQGGGDGAVGRTLLNGRALPSKTRVELRAGDVLTLLTPGGGGWGTS
jgi:N-methylhydantoinase B